MSSTSGLLHLRSATRNTVPSATVALQEERVIAAAQIVQYFIVREAAAIEPHVQNDRLLVEIVRIQRAHEMRQSLGIHAGNVNVTQFALAQFRNALRVLIQPALVHQLPHRAATDRLQIDQTFVLVARLRHHAQRHRFAQLVVEHCLARFTLSVNSTPSMASMMSPTLSLMPRLSAGPRLRTPPRAGPAHDTGDRRAIPGRRCTASVSDSPAT